MSERTDTELVAGVLAGDRDAFAAVYDRYADRLHDFCWSVLRDRDEAADAVQDTFVLAAQRLAQLNDPERLRPWLYAVARSVALRRVRARGRVVLDEVGDMADTDPGPHRAAEQESLRELVWTAAGGLSERDRALLDLHLRQGLEGAELGEAMGVSTSHAYVLLTRLRDQVERSLGALLIARLGREDCTELDALLSGWDGRFSPIMRKRVARHVDQCDVCTERKRVVVSPWALLAAVPLLPAPLWLKDRVMSQVQLASMDQALPTEPDPNEFDEGAGDGGAGGEGAAGAGGATEAVVPEAGDGLGPKRIRAIAAAAAVLALLAAVSVVVYWRNADPTERKPVALDNSVAPTTSHPRTTTTQTTTPTATPAPPPPTTATTTRHPTRTTTTPGRTTTTTTTTTVAQPPPPPPPPPPADTTRPVITDHNAPGSLAVPCGPTAADMVVAATDNVGVVRAVLSWAGENTGSTVMTFSDGLWRGELGPVSLVDEAASWTATVYDAAGNTAATGGTFVVSGCVS